MSSLFFISYQRDSQDVAEDLERTIRTSDYEFSAWMDTYIPASDDWKDAIDKEIQNSLGVIVLVTVEALRSPYVTYEWAYAMGLRKPVIPVILEKPDPSNPDHPAMHPKLEDVQWADDFSGGKPPNWDKTLEALNKIFQREDIPDTVKFAVAALNSHRSDEHEAAIHTLEKYDHSSATRALAQAISRPMPEIQALAGAALARKSEFSDLRALSGLRVGLDLNKLTPYPKLIARFNSPEALDALMAHVRQDNNLEMIQAIGEAIINESHFRETDTVPALRELLRDQRCRSKHWQIVERLGILGDARAIPEIVNYLRPLGAGQYPEITTGVKAFGLIAHPDALDVLDEILQSYYPRHSKLHIDTLIDTLQAIGGQRAIEMLEDAREIKRQFPPSPKIQR